MHSVIQTFSHELNINCNYAVVFNLCNISHTKLKLKILEQTKPFLHVYSQCVSDQFAVFNNSIISWN